MYIAFVLVKLITLLVLLYYQNVSISAKKKLLLVDLQTPLM